MTCKTFFDLTMKKKRARTPEGIRKARAKMREHLLTCEICQSEMKTVRYYRHSKVKV